MRKLTNSDQESQSIDGIAENLDQIARLFPTAVTEDGIDFDVLKQLLGDVDEGGDEKFGLVWHGKRAARKAALIPSAGTMRPHPERSLDWESTRNLIFEGDNLEVLKLLQRSYHGKVSLIFIDPPYNTGNDFIYPDNYAESLQTYLEYTGQVDSEGRRFSSNTESGGRFHSKWLNMMYPRLYLARTLLKDDGLIFISIDDSEGDNLRKICDEIFGEENFLERIVWKKRYGGGAKEKFLVSLHEYILCYARNLDAVAPLFVPQSEESIERYYTQQDEHFDRRGPYRTHPLEATKSMGDRPNLVFPIVAPDGSTIMPKRQWLWSKERVTAAQASGELEFIKDKNGNWGVSTKQYLKDESGETRKSKAFSVIDDVYTQHGTNEILELFGDAHVFPFPKPTKLIKFLLNLGAQDDDAIVLDFFAGSGATAQAVLDLNVEDGGNRRYILVQLPEPTGRDDYPKITDITEARIRRVVNLIKDRDSGKLVQGENLDLGFRYFTLDSSNIQSWEPDRNDLEGSLLASVDHLKHDRSEDDIFYELLLKLGLDLASPIERRNIAGKLVYGVPTGTIIACLAASIENSAIDELALGIAHWNAESLQSSDTVVVFRDSAFADDVAKTNITSLLAQSGIQTVRSL